MAHRQDHDDRGVGHFVQRDIPCGTEWDDEFASGGTLARLAKAVGRRRSLAQHCRTDGLVCRLSLTKVFHRLHPVLQDVEEPNQVVFGLSAETNFETHRPGAPTPVGRANLARPVLGE